MYYSKINGPWKVMIKLEKAFLFIVILRGMLKYKKGLYKAIEK